MGFIDFFVDTIKTGFSFAVNAVVTLTRAAVNFIHEVSPVVKQCAKLLALIPGPVGAAAAIVAATAEVLGKLCDVILDTDKVADIGERAIQAYDRDGISLATCNNDFDLYMEKLRNFDIDPKVAEQHPEDMKNIAGFLVIENGFKSKLSDTSIIPFSIAAAKNPDFFTEEKLTEYKKLADERNVPLKDIATFFEEGNTTRLAKSVLVDTEKNLNPSLTKDEIITKLDEVHTKDLPLKDLPENISSYDDWLKKM